MSENISEQKENYWSGFFDASRGTINEDGIKLFLKSRNLFFDLNCFHPGDMKVIKETIDYQRGKFENGAVVKTIDDIPMILHENKEFIGNEALVFLDKLYGTIQKDDDCYEPCFFLLYKKLMSNNPRFLDSTNKKIQIQKLNPKAVIPKKNNCLEPGYIIFGSISNSTTKTTNIICDTFLNIIPPYGYYFEIYEHPRLHELKHSFVEPTPIILNQQSSSSHSLKFKLKKKSKTVPDLPDNCPIALLIPRLFAHFPIEEIQI